MFPLIYEAYMKMSPARRENLLYDCMISDIWFTTIQKIPWYATGAFKTLVSIVFVLIDIISAGSTKGATAVLYELLKSLAYKYAIDFFCRLSCRGLGQAAGGPLEADVHLSGSIAQIGRTGIIEEIAKILIQDFVRNVEAALKTTDVNNDDNVAISPEPDIATGATPISGFSILIRSIKAWIRSLVGGSGKR